MTGPGPVEDSTARFFADMMLGRLATWMRALGFDVEYERGIEDRELVGRAVSGGRIILTRDTLLVKRKDARGRSFFIESDDPFDQLRQVVRRFPIEPGRFLTRCLRCNAGLARVDKNSVRDRVPAYVYSTQESFSVCPACHRVYWAGTHADRMKEVVEGLV